MESRETTSRDAEVTRERQTGNGRTPLPTREVVVSDVKMSFGSMVAFMVKWSIASIPALIILAVLFSILVAVLGGIFGGFF